MARMILSFAASSSDFLPALVRSCWGLSISGKRVLKRALTVLHGSQMGFVSNLVKLPYALRLSDTSEQA